MSIIAKAASLVGGTVAALRRMNAPSGQAFGQEPNIPKPEGKRLCHWLGPSALDRSATQR